MSGGKMMAEGIVKDVGRKCADDVADAIRRNSSLVEEAIEKLVVTAYGAAASIGAVNGIFHALSGATDGPVDEAVVDEMWRDFLRPMVLGNLSKGIRP